MFKSLSSYPDGKIEILVKSGETYNLNVASFDLMKNAEFFIKVEKDGTFNCAFADFSTGEGKIVVSIDLEEGATSNFHLASLSKGDDKKIFDTSVYHLGHNSSAIMSNYGITRDASKLTFTGTSKINNGSYASSSRQEAKIIVFDEACDGKCSPILKIDENDVSASHAASVGKLSDEHLYYLLSRGISLEDAKRLITLGYLKPIEQYFSDKATVELIEKAIEEGI